MKCPKCGYVGFEETPRCRHCGYDFSFAAPVDAATAGRSPPARPRCCRPSAWPTSSSRRAGSRRRRRSTGWVSSTSSVSTIEPAGPLVDLPLATVTPSDLFADSPPPARPPLAVRRASRTAAQPADDAGAAPAGDESCSTCR